MRSKIRISLISIIALLLLLPSFSYATSHIVVIVNGEVLQSEAEPVIKNGVTFVPLRGIFELLGATVDWNAKLKTVTAKKGETTVQLTMGSSTGYRNKEKVTLEVKPQIIKGSTMVPLRFIGQAFGGKVDWMGETRTVIIEDGRKETHPVIFLTTKKGVVLSTYPDGSKFDIKSGDKFSIVLDKAFTDVWRMAVTGSSTIPITLPTTLKNGDMLFTFEPSTVETFTLHVEPVKYDASQGYDFIFNVTKP
jgi:hypothetical protein